MPRTSLSCSDELSIALQDFKSWFSPGDPIVGTVNRKRALPGNCVVKLTFYGRAKTKIDVKTSNARTLNRGRASLFSETHVLHQGGVGDDAHFPFNVTVPETTQPGMKTRGDSFHRVPNPKERFLSSEDDVSQHSLPSSFYYKGDRSIWSGKQQESYVEYVLLAELTGPKTKITATFPLFIHARSTPSPLQDRQLATQSQFFDSKMRLVSGAADGEQSMWQKSMNVFTSKAPKVGFNLCVEVPSLIQLEHPDPVPIGLYVDVFTDPERKYNPTVGLDLVTKLNLKARTEIRAPGTFVDHESGRDHEYVLLQSYHVAPSVAIPVQSVWIESSQVGTSGLTPLQLGEVLQLRIDTEGVTCQEKRHEFEGKRRLQPSFKTYNINVSYWLEWKFVFRWGAMVRPFEGSVPVTVLPPSEQQESLKMQELGTEGMKKSYDDYARAAEIGLTGLDLVTTIIQGFGG
ncbi:hypothetical protein F5Y18DRAFT_81770 [Xylariaceae sp. FL1019]|nr:hypothetical protein F5Y18DRAFT_81770 [Xylariaceae sp. FL1019]